jgi:hypothetical protein
LITLNVIFFDRVDEADSLTLGSQSCYEYITLSALNQHAGFRRPCIRSVRESCSR